MPVLGSGSNRLRFWKFLRPRAWPWGIKKGHREEGPRTERLCRVPRFRQEVGLLFPNLRCNGPVHFQTNFGTNTMPPSFIDK